MLYSKSFDFKYYATMQSCHQVRCNLATIYAFDDADGSIIAKAGIMHLVRHQVAFPGRKISID